MFNVVVQIIELISLWQIKLGVDMSGTDGDTETSEQQSQHKPGNITLDRQVSDSHL